MIRRFMCTILNVMITAGVAGALERAEIENLADMFNKGEYSQFLKEYENYEAAALSAPDQLKLCSLFLEAHFVKPKEIPLSKVESFYRRGTQQLRSSEEFAYAYGEFNMRLLAAKGEYQAAAAEAGRLKKEWGEKLNRVLPVYAKEPVLLLKAGLKEQAIRLVNETWINNPNNYAINEAVRIELADALYGYGDVQLAFDLLSELRLSYPMEFRSSPYVVQNYINLASVAKHSEEPSERLAVLEDVAQFAEGCINSGEYEHLLAPMAYCTAKLFHLLLDTEKAKRYYAMAAENAGEGEFGSNIKNWSLMAVGRIEKGDFANIVSLAYGAEFAEQMKAIKRATAGLSDQELTGLGSSQQVSDNRVAVEGTEEPDALGDQFGAESISVAPDNKAQAIHHGEGNPYLLSAVLVLVLVMVCGFGIYRKYIRKA